MPRSRRLTEWQKPSKLGFSYEQVRGMDDADIITAGLDSGDRLAHELANRYDVVIEKLEKLTLQTAGEQK